MIRTEQIRIKKYKALSNQCHLAKNLYNEANYIVRQVFIQTTKLKEERKIENAEWIRYNELDTRLQTSENYKSLPSQTAQQTLMLLDKNWKSFFEAIREWKRIPSKFKGMPSLPKYKAKDGESVLIFTNQQIRTRNGYIKFPKKTRLKSVKTRINSLKELRIVPKGTDYMIEIIYNKQIERRDLDKNRIAGIDFGSKNIITMVNNIGKSPIVVKDDGRGIKSINQFYNKEKAKIQSIYDLQGIKQGKRKRKLGSKHNRKVKDSTHKLTRFIIDYCIAYNIGKLIIGYNPEWKRGINLGRKTNQLFTQIPYLTLINQLQYKGEEIGLEVKEQEESHTSKCSFLDNESVEHHEPYLGKRIRRGMFQSANGILINADVNGAYNIIQKSEPDVQWTNGVGGCGLHPISFCLANKQNLLKELNNV